MTVDLVRMKKKKKKRKPVSKALQNKTVVCIHITTEGLRGYFRMLPPG